MTSPVLIKVENGIAWLTLNRPEVGNAIDLAMARSLVDAAERCDTDAAIRCVVLTGVGPLFCAGGDLGLFVSAGETIEAVLTELADTLHKAVAQFARMAKPLLVLVNGPAAGAGLSLAISGDIVISTRSAHFTAAYGSIGLTPDGGMSWLLPKLVGLRRAQEIILTNRRINAEEAEQLGLITRTVDDGELLKEGSELAARFTHSATAAFGVARRLLHTSFTADLETQLALEASAISRAGASAEGREGIAALVEKRRPDFRKSQ